LIYSLPQPLQSLTDVSNLYYTALWRITRTDGTILRFTDHDCPLVVGIETFTPAGGFSASARQHNADLKPTNLELIGILDNASISHDDLRAGKYREAMVEEMVVDRRFPWAGNFSKSVYWVDQVKFSNGRWDVQISGLMRWLQPHVGQLYGRTCRYKLGSTGCTVNLAGITITGIVTSISTTQVRKRFIASALIGHATNQFAAGLLTWTSGNNNGLLGEVKSFNGTTGEFVFQLSAPFNIQVSDTFTVYPGCDKQATTCLTKFSNLVNFGGFPTVPGEDVAIQTPGSNTTG